MGKLHKIRKAIEADPQAWMTKPVKTWDGKRSVPFAYPAVFSKGQARPAHWSWWGNSYRRFVVHTLRNLGYDVK